MGARYSKHSGYTISKRQTTSRQTTRTVKQRVTFGPTTAKYFGIGVIAVILTIGLSNSTQKATGAYKQNQLRTATADTQQQVDNLSIEARRLQALSTLENSDVAKTMTPGTDPTFVPSSAPTEQGQVAGVSTSRPTSTASSTTAKP